MASYESYFNQLIKQAQDKQAAYTNERRQQADTAASEVRAAYGAAEKAAAEQYRQSVADTADSYREAYDANAVSEAVARRNAAEAIANSQLTNSGWNATQQTALSLARTKADAAVTSQKQAAVDSIMRELDAVRAQYRQQSAAATADIYEQADKDIRAYEAEQTETAQSLAKTMYEADLDAAAQAAKLNSKGSEDSSLSTKSVTYKAYENTPSKTAIEINAAMKKKQQGDTAALMYLQQCCNEGLITAQERHEIMLDAGIREVQEYSYGYVEGMVERMLESGNKSDARVFLETLLQTGRVEYDKVKDLVELVR